ncbi:MAG: hypothetical protein NTY98_01110 [Verrucomicrobia bacterium]|nr:hypothetical protein [Verrucomicrobiota bacterium]
MLIVLLSTARASLHHHDIWQRLLKHGLSGGDILNMCVNAIHAGSTDDDPAMWLVTQKMLEHEIAKVKKAKAEHSGEKGKSRRRIGFQPS